MTMSVNVIMGMYVQMRMAMHYAIMTVRMIVIMRMFVRVLMGVTVFVTVRHSDVQFKPELGFISATLAAN